MWPIKTGQVVTKFEKRQVYLESNQLCVGAEYYLSGSSLLDMLFSLDRLAVDSTMLRRVGMFHLTTFTFVPSPESNAWNHITF